MTLDDKRPTFLVAWIGVICLTFWSLGQLLEPEPVPTPTRAQGVLEAPRMLPEPPAQPATLRVRPFPAEFSLHELARERPAAQAGSGRAFSPFAAPGAQDPVTLLPPQEPGAAVVHRPPEPDEDGAGRGRSGPRAVDNGEPDASGPDVQRHALVWSLPERRSARAATAALAQGAHAPRTGRDRARSDAGALRTRLELIPRPRGRFLVRFAVQDPAAARRAARAAGELPDRVLDEARAWCEALEEARCESASEEDRGESGAAVNERWQLLADAAGQRAARSLHDYLARIPGGLEFVAELDAEQLERLWRHLRDQGLPARS